MGAPTRQVRTGVCSDWDGKAAEEVSSSKSLTLCVRQVYCPDNRTKVAQWTQPHPVPLCCTAIQLVLESHARAIERSPAEPFALVIWKKHRLGGVCGVREEAGLERNECQGLRKASEPRA